MATRARSRKPAAKGSEVRGERKAKGIIMAPPGAGKTHLIGTASMDERTAPTAIFDMEGGVRDVLEGMPGEGTDWVHIPVASWSDWNEGYERLRVNDEGFKSLSVDSLSESHIFALMTILDDPGISRTDGDMLRQDDYGKAMIQIRRLTRELRDLPLHVFYTAHDKQEITPREGMVTTVNMSGKLATEIPGMMTFVGYLAQSEDEEGLHRTLLLQNYAKIRTKVRMPWGIEAPDEIEDPDIAKILDALHFV